ncbi:hypothetical protein R1sor_022600 [Riccia sorocarpa]|uniref:Uncharacterized protein n=1 Tax=Riccia sorocarpa TaxID=122646 RepID=A0ABD3GPI9_9MARC
MYESNVFMILSSAPDVLRPDVSSIHNMKGLPLTQMLLFILMLHGSVSRSEPSVLESDRILRDLVYSETADQVILRNGELEIKFGKSRAGGGSIQSLVYKRDGLRDLQLLDMNQTPRARGYWDTHWLTITGHPLRDVISTTSLDSVTMVELSGLSSMAKGAEGIRCLPPMQLSELRLTLKLNPELFDYTYVADDRQRLMPSRMDISRRGSSSLAFKDARLLTRPQNKSMMYEVDHNYHYSVETKDGQLFCGLVSNLTRILG